MNAGSSLDIGETKGVNGERPFEVGIILLDCHGPPGVQLERFEKRPVLNIMAVSGPVVDSIKASLKSDP